MHNTRVEERGVVTYSWNHFFSLLSHLSLLLSAHIELPTATINFTLARFAIAPQLFKLFKYIIREMLPGRCSFINQCLLMHRLYTLLFRSDFPCYKNVNYSLISIFLAKNSNNKKLQNKISITVQITCNSFFYFHELIFQWSVFIACLELFN